MRHALRLLLLVTLALLPAALFAQKKPKENAQVLATVRIGSYHATDVFGVRFAVTGEWDWPTNRGTSQLCGSYSASNPSGWSYGSPGYVMLTPGVSYQMGLGGSWDYGEVKLSLPAGYHAYINGIPLETFRTPGNNGGAYALTLCDLVIRADDISNALPAGESLAPRVGDLIWQISAGRYANGHYAGAVQWRDVDFNADLLKASTLRFAEPDSSEVAVTYNSTDGGLDFVNSFQFTMNVVRNTDPDTGYTLEISDGSGSGPVYRKYIVSNPDGSTWNNRIQIEKKEIDSGTVIRTETWIVAKSGSNWTLTQALGARRIVLTSTINSSTGNREEILETKDASNVVATKLKRIYHTYAWGQEELITEIADPDTAALTTSFDYYTTSNTAGYGRLKSVTNPDSSWVLYEYDNSTNGWGNLSAVYSPFQDSPSTAASATSSNCVVTQYSYTADYTWDGNVQLTFADIPAGSETKILGYTAAKNVITYSSLYGGFAPNYGNRVQTQTIQTYSGTSAYTTTTRVLFHTREADEHRRGHIASETAPDGTKVSALCYNGYFWNYGDNNATDLHKWPGNSSADTTWGEYRFHGFSSAVTGGVLVSSWDGQAIDSLYMVPNRSTVELTIYDAEGRPWYVVNYVFTGATSGVPSFEFIGMEDYAYSAAGIRFSVHDSNGFQQQKALDGAILSGTVANDGCYTEYTRDVLNRDYLVRDWYVNTSGSYPAQGILYTHKTFDIAGRVLSQKVSSSGNSGDPGITTTSTYDLAGRVTSTTDADGLTTYYTYSPSTHQTTLTLPGGFTKTATTWLDGSLKEISGTAVVHSYQDVTVDSSTGNLTVRSFLLRSTDTTPTSAPRWSKVTTDWMGRTVKEESPAYSSGTFTKQYYYDSVGHLVKTTEPGIADNLVEYNDRNEAYRSGLDVNANGALNTASDDRIAETDVVFEKDGSNAWWAKTTSKAYNQSGNSTPITTGITKIRLNKYTGYVQSESVAIDTFGNETRKTVAVQRGSSNELKLVTETIDVPDASTDVVRVTRNGLLQYVQSAQNLTSWTYYDALRRPIKVTNPRTDTSTTARISYASNSMRVSSRQDTAGNATSYSYNGTTGRLASTTDPLGKISYVSYNDRGQVTRTWGDTAYPVEYTFNDYGEQTTMSTYRGGTGWTASTWSSSPGTADTTTWSYETATGLLLSKTDAASHAATYTYTARGQLSTRTWSRGAVSTYGYSSTTGEQTGITYSDGTPNLTYTYNRLGQSATVADVTGTRTFAYSTTNATLTAETLPSYFDGRVLSRSYDATTTGALGRNIGFSLSGASGSGTDYSASYGYDSSGRFKAVSGTAGSLSSSYTYSFASNSNLIATIAETSGWSETLSYESNRDLLSTISGYYGATSKAQFSYMHDVLGRRTNCTESGEIFARYVGGGLTTAYGYNDRGEVTSAQSYHGTSSSDHSQPVAGRGFGYAFDNIGSRTSSSVVGANPSDVHATTYANNNLNQVTARSAPSSTEVSGLAPTASTITINSSSSAITRQGDYFYKNVSAGSTPPLWQSIAVADGTTTTTRYSYLAATTESFTYDNDGNVTDDGRWHYTWDAENRLTSMETSLAAQLVGVPRQFLAFKYDYLGRRVRKTVSNWNGSTYVAALDRKFIYNGWNLVSEHNALSSNAAIARYLWGIDLSGNLTDGGGVGGLLAIFDVPGSATHLPAYDANGNIHALVNRSTGAVTAAYEYSPFGETLRATGSYAATNNFRFSTKYTDSESGLLYYGFRYYNPSLGRWLGRDPLGENGGLHLYGFCGNSPVNRFDVLGRDYQRIGTHVTIFRADDNGPTTLEERDFETEEEAEAWGQDHSYVFWGGGFDDSDRGVNFSHDSLSADQLLEIREYNAKIDEANAALKAAAALAEINRALQGGIDRFIAQSGEAMDNAISALVGPSNLSIGIAMSTPDINIPDMPMTPGNVTVGPLKMDYAFSDPTQPATPATKNAIIAVGDHKDFTGIGMVDFFRRGDVDVSAAVDASKARLESLGYNVRIDPQATASKLVSYLSNNDTNAFVYIGHHIGEGGAVGMVGADGRFASLNNFLPGGGSTPSANMRILVIAGCGSANAVPSGETWESVFDPKGRNNMWFYGYTDPHQPVDKALWDLISGKAFDRTH